MRYPETPLSTMTASEWEAMRSHCAMFSGFSFVRKVGRWYKVEGFGFARNSPLFMSKGEAEAYASKTILAESRRRAALAAEKLAA